MGVMLMVAMAGGGVVGLGIAIGLGLPAILRVRTNAAQRRKVWAVFIATTVVLAGLLLWVCSLVPQAPVKAGSD